MSRLKHSAQMRNLTHTSAPSGSSGPTPRSPKNRLTTPPQWWLGRRQSITASWASRVCAGILIISGTAYGDGGGGIPGILLGSPRDANGNLIMLGTGGQHWATVHVADLAAVFRSALENDGARGRYVIGNGLTPTVSELTEAAAVAVGAPGAISGSDQEARSPLGDCFAEVLLLDQATKAAKARAAARLATHSPWAR